MNWLASQESAFTKVGALALLAIAVYYGVRVIVLPIVHRIAKKSATKWDDILLDQGLLKRLSWILPPVAVWAVLPRLNLESDSVDRIATASLVAAAVIAASAILNGVDDVYAMYSKNS